MSRKILVLAAQVAEVKPLLKRAERLEKGRRRGRPWGRVRVGPKGAGSTEVVVATTGEGRRLAREASESLMEQFSPSFVLGVGAAGALAPSLSACSLVLSLEVRAEEGDRLPGHAPAVALAQEIGALVGSALTVDRVVGEPSEKLALWRSVSSAANAVVDMESYEFARSASNRGIPFVVLRVIADQSDEALPIWLNECRRPDGSLSRTAVAARMAFDPRSAGALLRMGRRLKSGSRGLAAAAEKLLVSAATSPPPGVSSS